MARKPAPGTRDRILDTAARLFYDHGVHAVGQQQVVEECGCGKNLLYREFPSKDELVVAYLERCRQDWATDFARTTEPLADDPAGQLVAVVRATASAVAAPGYRGCPFQNVYAEFPEPEHPAHQISIAHRNDILAHLRQIAERTGTPDPETLADRILLIIDGVYANGAVLGSNGAAAVAVAFAEEVVRAATTGSPPAGAPRTPAESPGI
jgi:AcrR family transcriptional regulator